MKILFFSNLFPKPRNPLAAPFNWNLLTALSRRGHSIHVVSPEPWVQRLFVRKVDETFARRLTEAGIAAEFPLFYYPPRLLRACYGNFMWASTRVTLRRVVSNFQPDVVLSYWSHPDTEVAVRAAKLNGAPTVAMVGGSDVLILTKDPARRARVRAALLAADYVVAVSRDLKAKIQSLGIDSGKIGVIYRGTDRAVFSPAARPPRDVHGDPASLLWIGRMEPVKGLPTLIDACAQLAPRLKFQLNLVGDGSMKAALVAQVRRKGLTERVRFHPAVRQTDLAPWYRSADLFVMPSLSEGVPNVLLEAIACGCRLVASAVGGIPEIADPHRDRLVPPNDPAALARAIESCLRAPTPVTPRSFVAGSWNDSAAELERVMLRCLEESSKSLSA